MNVSSAACGLLSLFLATAAGGAARPNVLLVIADDLRDYGGAFAREVVQTPALDRLRQRGLTLTHSYVQYPVCNPSRVSLLTGWRPEQSGIVGNQQFFRDTLPEVVTLPELLRHHGYTTHAFGKVLHTANTGEVRREAWADLGKSWDVAREFTVRPAGDRGRRRQLGLGQLPWCEIGAMEGSDDDQPDGQTAAAAMASIEQLSATKKPWMVAAGFHRPHDPFLVPAAYFERYPQASLRLHRDPAGISPSAPLSFSPKWVGPFAAFSEDDRRDFLQAYLAGVSFMDAQVGRLLATLDRLHLWDDTLVIFLGDHGYHLGERGWWNKHTLFERSCRAPLIVAGMGVPQGAVASGLVEFIDLYPTVAEVCGLTPPPGLPGRSFQPLFADPAAPHRETAMSMVSRDGGWGRSLRTEHWRFNRWSDGTRELYAHPADEEEGHDVSQDPAMAGVIAALEAQLAAQAAWPQAKKK